LYGARYLDTWLRVLKSDNKAIFTAASKASEAVAFLAAWLTELNIGIQPNNPV
jgi:antirestriction protein ArdC